MMFKACSLSLQYNVAHPFDYFCYCFGLRSVHVHLDMPDGRYYMQFLCFFCDIQLNIIHEFK